MTKGRFEIATSITSPFHEEEISALVGTKADYFSPPNTILPSGRLRANSVWIHYGSEASGSVSSGLMTLVKWLDSFLPNKNIEVRVAVLFRPRGQDFFPTKIYGDAVHAILKLGATVDFDDVLDR